MYNENAQAKYPAALATFNKVRDQVTRTAFETAPWAVVGETHTVPSTSPYVVRLNYVAEETRDANGYPNGITIAGMTELPWSDTAAPTSGKFMYNYVNGELKFAPDKASESVAVSYSAVGSWAFAELWNRLQREIEAIEAALGININEGFPTLRERIEAIEAEIRNGRGGFASLDTRLDDMDSRITPIEGAQWTSKEPSAATGVLGSAAIVLTSDLKLDPATVTTDTVHLKKTDDNTPITLTSITLSADGKTITATHASLVDAVYTAYTTAGILDTLGRPVNTTTWNFGVGTAIANDKPVLTPAAITDGDLNGFTAKTALTDTENDTINRIDVMYGYVNDPNDAGNITVQLAGGDIALVQGAGKRINASLTPGTVYVFYRALEQMPAGGTQLSDWTASINFTVLADALPGTISDSSKILIANQSTAGCTLQVLTIDQPVDTDDSSPPAVYTFQVAKGVAQEANIISGANAITPAQLNAGFAITDANAAGASVTYFIRLTSENGGVTQHGNWSVAKTFSIPTNTAPTATIAISNVGPGGFTAQGTVSGVGGDDSINRIRVVYMIQGTDADEAAAVTAGRYFDLTQAADTGSSAGGYQHAGGYTKTGLALTIGQTIIPSSMVTENMQGGGTQSGAWTRGTAQVVEYSPFTASGVVWGVNLAKADGANPGVNNPLLTTIQDLTANNNDATLNNFSSPGTTSSGYAGAGSDADPYRIVADGSNDHLKVTRAAVLEPASAMTVEMWVKLEALLASQTTGWPFLFGKRSDAGTVGYSCNFSKGADTLAFGIYAASDNLWKSCSLASAGTTFSSTSTIYRIECSFDGRYMKIYVGTTEVASFDIGVTTTIKPATAQDLFIMAGADVANNACNGALARMRMLNRVLTTQERANDYAAGAHL